MGCRVLVGGSVNQVRKPGTFSRREVSRKSSLEGPTPPQIRGTSFWVWTKPLGEACLVLSQQSTLGLESITATFACALNRETVKGTVHCGPKAGTFEPDSSQSPEACTRPMLSKHSTCSKGHWVLCLDCVNLCGFNGYDKFKRPPS